jgi:pimeloyl-ACP methyl ester carboxylesterase/DNA-binding CsgD family transcriptional regulator
LRDLIVRPAQDDESAAFQSSSGQPLAIDFRARSSELTSQQPLHALVSSSPHTKHVTLRETRYARNGQASIAFQTFGEGHVEIVLGLGWLSNLDAAWEEPRFAQFLSRLGAFARVVAYDARGTGLSDSVPLSERVSLDDRVDDLRAVIDAAHVSNPALVGFGASGLAFMHLAATERDRVRTLVVINGAGTGLARRVSDDTGAVLLDPATVAPSAAHEPAFTAWWEAFVRRCASPGSVRGLAGLNAGIDVRPGLAAIQAPTLVLHRVGNRAVPVTHGRELAALIPGAVLRELPGDDHLPYIGDADALVGEIEQFLTGRRRTKDPDTDLATVLVVDVADSAEVATALGERQWADRWAQVEASIVREIESCGGRRTARTPTGAIAEFGAPDKAVQCALRLSRGIPAYQLTARIGLHAGELPSGEARRTSVVTQLALRAARLARPGAVLATEAVAGMTHGGDVTLELVGDHPMPGHPGGMRLYRAQHAGEGGTPFGTDAVDVRPLTTLSRREREIAALIAIGLSNRQIGEELGISVGTVERHVANMLGKLGYRSRTQIAGWAADHALVSAPSPNGHLG